MEFEYSYDYIETDFSSIKSIEGDSLESVDYAGQIINNASPVFRAVAVGVMMFTFSLCEPVAAQGIKTSLSYCEPEKSTVELIKSDFFEEQKDFLDQLRQQWRVETMNLGQLRDDWDGEGALRVSTTAIRNVLKLLDSDKVRIDLIQDIYPNEKGIVVMEWENTNGECAGIQMGRQRMSYYVSLNDNDILEDYEPVNDEGIHKLFNYLSLL